LPIVSDFLVPLGGIMPNRFVEIVTNSVMDGTDHRRRSKRRGGL
jgi:hypothetical protein